MESRTVLDALAAMRAAGYGQSFSAVAQGVRCGGCGHVHSPSELVVEATERFEGESNPDDEAIVLALRCPACGSRGTLVAAFGPSAGPAEAELLRRLSAR